MIFIIILAIVLPIFILLLQSLSGNKIFLTEAFALLKTAIAKSFLLALVGAFVISFIALSSSYAEERLGVKSSGIILLFLFITPSIVLGIALIYFYNIPAATLIYSSPFIIILGYVGRFGFIAHKILGNGLKQIPLSFEEAAKLSGINTFKRYTRIILPLLLPSFITGFVLVFILCISELGTTIMVYPPGTELMPLKLFTISANAPQALTSTMTLINLCVIFLFLFILYYFSRFTKTKSWV